MSYESTINCEDPRVLMFSQRNIHETLHYRCALREFEDLVCAIDKVEMLAPTPKNHYRHSSRLALKLAAEYGVSFNPGIPKFHVDKEYDMFFAFCMFPKELLHVESVKGWDKCSKVSVCWIDEIWLSDLYWCRYYLDILAKFDVVMITLRSSVDAVSEKIGKRVHFLPLATNSLLFSPYPNAPERSIDVYSLGRRSETTHKKLLELTKSDNYFYIFDTMDAEEVLCPVEHRILVSNLAKRSRYFLVNPGKVDIPDETTIQSEFGARYFEGCAAGTIMIGEQPQTPSFEEIFHWPNAVIEFPFGGENIEDVIDELEQYPEMYESVRRENVIQSLNNHDWMHRWSFILEKAGMQPCDELLERENHLRKISESIGE